jgi:hypothetical protein
VFKKWIFALVIEGMTLFSLVIESMVSESDGETYLGEFCSKCKKCSNSWFAFFARAVHMQKVQGKKQG